MARLTRRGFLQSSVGAAGAAAGATAMGAISVGGLSGLLGATIADAPAVAASDSIVAYVRSGAKGEVNIMVGNREITSKDPELVRRLIRAAE